MHDGHAAPGRVPVLGGEEAGTPADDGLTGARGRSGTPDPREGSRALRVRRTAAPEQGPGGFVLVASPVTSFLSRREGPDPILDPAARAGEDLRPCRGPMPLDAAGR